jgi:hypothetical protein
LNCNINQFPQRPDQQECWIHFVDIGHRYASCSGENEDQMVPLLLAQCPNFARPWLVLEPRTALDALDSNQIVLAFLRKLKSLPASNITFVSMLFGYACANFNKVDFENSISQIFQASFEQSWIEVSRAREVDVEWKNMIHHVRNVLSILVLQVPSSLLAYGRVLKWWMSHLGCSQTILPRLNFL